MKETNYNHHCHHHNHHHHCHHHNNHYCHSFSSPIWCQLCLRSFGSKISHFPSSRLVKFQHKIDFQPKRVSSFLKKKQEIMFVFSKIRPVFELLRSYLNLAKVDTIPSSSSYVGVPALLLRESLKKRTYHVFVLTLVNSTLEPNFTYFILPSEQKGCTYGILREF